MEIKELMNDYKINNNLDIEKLYNDFYSYVYMIIINNSKGYLKDEDIEEILTDTFFVIWKNRDKLKKERPIKPYIAGITKNLIKEKMRKNNNLSNLIEYEKDIQNISETNFFTEEREEIFLLKDSVEKLKDEDKKIFELYYYQNQKIKEISLLLNISETNIKQRLCRIRKKIKKSLEKKGGYRYEK